MNCSEACDLFSSRLDDELRADVLAQLDKHLINCTECQVAWSSFRSTVGLVRLLPVETANPSFVGSVLDRVRAFEAEEQETQLNPWDKPRPERDRWEWVARIREWMPQNMFRPVPAMALGCLVVGLGVGAAVSGWLGGSDSSTIVAEVGAGEPIGLELAEAPRTSSPDPASVSPFADIAGEIRAQESAPSIGTPFRTQDLRWDSNRGLQQQVGFRNNAAVIVF